MTTTASRHSGGASLRNVILASFGAILALTVLIGAFAMYRLQSVVDTTQEMAGETKRVAVLGRMNELSQELRAVDVLSHYNNNEASRAAYAVENAKAQEAFSTMWSTYAPTVSGPREQELAHALRTAWQHFLALEGEVSALDRAGEHDLADKVIATDFRKDADDFKAAVSAVLDYSQTRSNNASEAAAETGHMARDTLGVLLGFMSLLSVAVGWATARRIAHPITAITAVMRKLAQGHMNTEVPYIGRRDEIGAMADALHIFRDEMVRAEKMSAEAAEQKSMEAARAAEAAAEREAAASRLAAVVEGLGNGLAQLAEGTRLCVERPVCARV
jgi:methyl-accepting chemotaxis protein